MNESQLTFTKRQFLKEQTPIVTDAALFAERHHVDQQRKVTGEPASIHLWSVGMILSLVTDNEKLIAAGFLHDTIEDCDSVTYMLLVRLFGRECADLVLAVTEKDRTLSWKMVKEQAMDELWEMNQDEHLLKTADVISNLSDFVYEIETKGIASVIVHFNGNFIEYVKKYQQQFVILVTLWPENPLLGKLQVLVKRLEKLYVQESEVLGVI
ncbi:MAG: HD domain-containing protein [Patescibacteria group bacterium]